MGHMWGSDSGQTQTKCNSSTPTVIRKGSCEDDNRDRNWKIKWATYPR